MFTGIENVTLFNLHYCFEPLAKEFECIVHCKDMYMLQPKSIQAVGTSLHSAKALYHLPGLIDW